MCFVFFLYVSDQISAPIQLLSSAVTTLTPQQTSQPCQGSGIDNGGLDSGFVIPSWLMAHVILGAVGFGFLVPAGTLLPASQTIRALPNAAWFKGHKVLVGIGSLAGWIAFAIAIASITPKLATSHGKLGLAISALAIAQALLGVFRPHLPSAGEMKSQGRVIWEYAHPFLGRVIVVCSAAQMYLGYDLLNTRFSFPPSQSLQAWSWAHTIGIFALWLIVLAAFKASGKKPAMTSNKTADVAVADRA